jgi:8-oxo-dGTP pyrophosphatase MutT (NUDIX family)
MVASAPVADYRIFTIRSDRKLSPRTRREHDFYVIDCANWVNVVALTRDRKVVMVQQYRHGSNTTELETPGGMMDPGDASPEAAGQRELREETGYAGDPARILGYVYPNPAIMTNRCFTLLIQNCRCAHPTELDSAEDLVTNLVPVADLPALVAAGRIRHALVTVALYHLDLYLRGVHG